jgi:acyl carrier protein|tara:strand:+ start:1240 stop:1467 length:228 start_codon:yes stop_codon:yes gene_type:complete
MNEELFKIISEALGSDLSEISIESTSNDIDEWDSLGHLSILQELDIKYNDITERVPELASVSTVKEIIDLVTANL